MDASAELVRLVRAAQKRDHEAFLSLIDRLRPRLVARALSYVNDPSAAEDLLQETYLRAYEKLNDLHDPATVLSWMLTILDRFAQRETQRGRRLQQAEPLDDVSDMAGAASLLELGESFEKVDELRTAIGGLEPSDRELLALRFGANLNATQIAEATGSTSTAVRMHLSRVVGRLRQMLGVKR